MRPTSSYGSNDFKDLCLGVDNLKLAAATSAGSQRHGRTFGTDCPLPPSPTPSFATEEDDCNDTMDASIMPYLSDPSMLMLESEFDRKTSFDHFDGTDSMSHVRNNSLFVPYSALEENSLSPHTPYIYTGFVETESAKMLSHKLYNPNGFHLIRRRQECRNRRKVVL